MSESPETSDKLASPDVAGAAAHSASPLPLGTVDAAGNVCIDRTCLRCGYNLRGLHHAGNCPECGVPVSNSLYGNLLCYSEPTYVKKLARGARLIVGSISAAVIAAIVEIALMMITVWWSPQNVFGDLVACGGMLAGWTFVIALVVGYVGAWFLTVPQPDVSIAGSQARSRRFARVNLLVAFVAAALVLAKEGLRMPAVLRAGLDILLVLCGVLGAAGMCAYFLYLQGLARRVPEETYGAKRDLISSAQALAIMAAVVIGLSALLSAARVIASSWLLRNLAGGGTPPTVPPTTRLLYSPYVSCAQSLLALATLVLFVRAYRFHYHLRNTLNRQLELAEKHWRESESASLPRRDQDQPTA